VKVDWLTAVICCDEAAAQLAFGIELGLDCELRSHVVYSFINQIVAVTLIQRCTSFLDFSRLPPSSSENAVIIIKCIVISRGTW